MKNVLRGIYASGLIVAMAFALLVVTAGAPVAAVPCPPAKGSITNIVCGGIAGIPCPGNLVCVDDPRDNCCPENGGADCSGVCAHR